MADISLVYYTANIPPEPFLKKIRDSLIESARGKPIISVSQKPMDFGENICVDLKPCLNSIYKQIIIGAKAAKTKYVACCEDDTLYVPEHFDYKPPDNAFACNVNYWCIQKGIYYFRGHRITGMYIAPAELIIKVFEATLNNDLRNARVRRIGFSTEIPTIAFRHPDSLNGVKRIFARYPKRTELPYWGNAEELWNRIYG